MIIIYATSFFVSLANQNLEALCRLDEGTAKIKNIL